MYSFIPVVYNNTSLTINNTATGVELVKLVRNTSPFLITEVKIASSRFEILQQFSFMNIRLMVFIYFRLVCSNFYFKGLTLKILEVNKMLN